MQQRSKRLSGAIGLGLLAVLAACDNGQTVQTVSGPASDGETPSGVSAQEEARAVLVSFAEVELEPASESNVHGTLDLAAMDNVATNNLLRIRGEVTGLEPGVHGFHIHEKGDCSASDASSAGGHFAMGRDRHGAPSEPEARHHAGDLGNIVADSNGVAEIDISLPLENLDHEPDAILNRALVLHAKADDLISQPSGGAGARVACGIIRKNG